MNIIDQLPNEKALTLKEEASLQKRGRLSQLVMANMREAVVYAKACNGKIADDELVSICYDTLMKTAKKFHPKHRVRFFAYSKPRIRGALIRHFSTSALVRNGDCISLDDSRTHCTSAAADHVHRFSTEDVSECFPENAVEPEFDLMEFRERFAEISHVVIKHCNDREQAILMLVFNYSFTFERAGRCFGICRAAAQAIASDAIDRVRKIILNK
jgi:DNA-directed RNA polymerase specialized sigma subunit